MVYQEDCEIPMSSDEELVFGSAPRRRGLAKRFAIGVLGLAALAACFVVVWQGSGTIVQPSRAPAAPHSARMLLESSELTEVATDQLMSLGHKILHPDHRPAVRAIVSEGFKNITGYIRRQHPQSFEVLESMHLTAEQRSALLQVLPRMDDPRMQKLGLEVAQAVKECGGIGRVCVKNKVKDTFQPRFTEIRQLRNEIIPSALRETDSEWGVTVDPEQMTLVKNLPSDWKLEVDVSPEVMQQQPEQLRRLASSSPLGLLSSLGNGTGIKLEDSFAIITAFAEQARILLDQIDRLSRVFGHELPIPGWSRSLVGALDLFTGVSSCVMDAKDNTLKLAMCPLKYESAAADLFKVFTGKHAPWRAAPTTLPGATTSAPVVGTTSIIR